MDHLQQGFRTTDLEEKDMSGACGTLVSFSIRNWKVKIFCILWLNSHGNICFLPARMIASFMLVKKSTNDENVSFNIHGIPIWSCENSSSRGKKV